ncbi:monocyte chemotactic protein 1B-like, partial [Clarias magur]
MSAYRMIILSAVVVLLSAVTLTEGMRYKASPNVCCFSFQSRPLKSTLVASYSPTSSQCSKQAIL